MAKTYVDSVKYMIHTEFKIDGVVDKPDIVGAIFGQSEGLLGEQMDLKELQKAGKVGRIEINHKTHLGKTTGEILTPSSMDMVQTSILAATVEAVDKVGPCDAKFETTKIEDLRSAKRQVISSRARELLQKFKLESLPSQQELETNIREGARAAEIRTWGKDRLPCGPDIETGDEIIVVEGRADVINLLRNNINNVIGMGGTKISETLVPLLRNKSVTVFIDGDRGGELNARKLMQIAKVDFIAHAPEGKEVEELAGKEVVMTLRKKTPASGESGKGFGASLFGRPLGFGMRSYEKPGGRPERPGYRQRASRPQRERPGYDAGDSRGRGAGPRAPARAPFGRPSRGGGAGRGPYPAEREPREFTPRLTPEEAEKFTPVMQSLKSSLHAKIFDAGMKELADVGIRELVDRIPETKNAYAVVFDGIITKRLADAADAAGITYIVGMKSGKLDSASKVKALVLKV